ncbi:GFA family protein [Salmonella enterica subsp. enterica serovar Typhimurium]|nr:GFA family protein [Salmonella enterica subsp. enterica serovar Typhimurium]
MKGSCLCKAIGYECDELISGIVNCHCNTCRKSHAAPYVPTAGVKREHFRWIKGFEYLKSYESSQGKLRHFCSICGSHLVADRPSQSHVILRVATLDDAPPNTVVSHIWCSHDVSWLRESDSVPHFDEWQ